MTHLELIVALEIQRYFDDKENVRVCVRSHAAHVEVEASCGTVSRVIVDQDLCRHGAILSDWCRRTAEKLRRLVKS